MRGEAGLMADLDAHASCFTVHEHAAVFTVAESRLVNGGIAGDHSKNLFLKDNRGAFWLITVPAEARVDLKGLGAAIGSGRVSFAGAQDMERLLGITPGSVTPLCAINAEPRSVTFVLDAALAASSQVNVHPLRNTATVSLSGATIIALLRHWGHEPVIAAIPTQESR